MKLRRTLLTLLAIATLSTPLLAQTTFVGTSTTGNWWDGVDIGLDQEDTDTWLKTHPTTTNPTPFKSSNRKPGPGIAKWVCKTGTITIQVDNVTRPIPSDQQPVVVNGTTYMSIRSMESALGTDNFKVAYDSTTKTITATNVKSNQSVVLREGYNVALVGKNQIKEIGQYSVESYNSRAYLPLRFISENLGYKVIYHNPTRTICISTTGEDPKPPTTAITSGVIYKPGMNPKDLTDRVPEVIEEMTISKSGNQAYLGINGNQLMVGPTNPYDSADKTFAFKMLINGWNNPNYNDTPDTIKRNATTMQATKQVLSMFTTDYENVYKELDEAIVKNKDNGYTVKTSDGRTFRFSGESSGIIIRIK